MGTNVNYERRNKINDWLVDHGYEAIPTKLDYVGFANRLRGMIEPEKYQPTFKFKVDAVTYVHETAEKLGKVRRK